MANLPVSRRESFFGNRSDRDNPFRAMARMQRDMDRMFDRFWGGEGNFEFPEVPSMQALCDVKDEGSHFVLSYNVPGFGKNDIKIEAQDNQLHIFGEKSTEKEEKKGQRWESSYGSIDQWLTLPTGTKAEQIEAKIENGVLQVAIPKTEASQSKRIEIGEGKSGFFSKLLGKKEKAA